MVGVSMIGNIQSKVGVVFLCLKVYCRNRLNISMFNISTIDGLMVDMTLLTYGRCDGISVLGVIC